MPFLERTTGDDESENELLLGDNSNEVKNHHLHQQHHHDHKSHLKSHARDNRDRNENNDIDQDDECIVGLGHGANSSVESKINRIQHHNHRHDNSVYLKDELQSKRVKKPSKTSSLKRTRNNLEAPADGLQNSSDSSTNSILVDIGLVSDLDTSPLIQFDNSAGNVQRVDSDHSNSERRSKRHSFIRSDTDTETHESRHSHHHHHHEASIPRMNQNGLANPGYDPEDERHHQRSSSTGSYHCHLPKNDPLFHKQKNTVVFRKLITVLIMCIFFMVAEIVGGVLAHSISIQTDAAHMAADIAGFALSILALHLSSKSKLPFKKIFILISSHFSSFVFN